MHDKFYHHTNHKTAQNIDSKIYESFVKDMCLFLTSVLQDNALENGLTGNTDGACQNLKKKIKNQIETAFHQ